MIFAHLHQHTTTNHKDYEFLDLSDVNADELNSLKCTLLINDEISSNDHLSPSCTLSPSHNGDIYSISKQLHIGWTDPHYDFTSSSSGTPGPPTATSSLDSLSASEGEMPPHSPARHGGASQQSPSAPPVPAQPPPAQYSAPPPPIYAAAPNQPWSVVPPNVYVSQVTANVNVHGYMGQYYQPQQQTYQQNDRRKGRKTKRGISPPPQAPPQQQHYVPYNPYFPQHGAPLYHVPVYPQVGYMGYPYSPYAEYHVAEDPNAPEKVTEEYPPEMMIEHEPHLDNYYAAPQYLPHMYEPHNRHMTEAGAYSMEYPVYMPPPHHIPPPPHHISHHQHHQQSLQVNTQHHQYVPSQHQFNVYAKNFVRQSDYNKATTHMPPPTSDNKPQETQTNLRISSPPPTTVSAADSLPIKELKINPVKPTHENPSTSVERVILTNKSPPPLTVVQPVQEKVIPKQSADSPKPSWPASSGKSTEVSLPPKPTSPVHVLTNTTTASQKSSGTSQHLIASRPSKTSAPFNNVKQVYKSSPHHHAASTHPHPGPPQSGPPSKAPFPNKQKRDPTSKSTEINIAQESVTEKHETQTITKGVVPPVQSPLPQVAGKAPFSHGRRGPAIAVLPEPVTPPPMPAPSAADFPPPPTPRIRSDASQSSSASPSASITQSTPTPPAKSWASLFNKASSNALEENISHSSSLPPANVGLNQNQKPVAKVGPFDASPLQHADKIIHSPSISYSEKTSVNSHSNVPAHSSISKPIQCADAKDPPSTPKEVQALPPSIFADDPNSYRMGEFLNKYQLDTKNIVLQPRGLTNQSNFCYVNAILQALIACPPFYNMLKALPYQTRRGKSSTPIIDAMVELCYEFSAVPPSGVSSSGTSRGRTGIPAGALPLQVGVPLEGACAQRVLRAVRPSLTDGAEGRQEDAEEFLSCLLNGINDEMLELIKLVEPEEPQDTSVPNGIILQEELDEDDDDWKQVMGPRNRGAVERHWGGDGARSTPLSRIFRGRRRTRLQRVTPPLCTDTVEPFFTLQLEIEKSSSVKEALELIGGRDTIEGGSGEGGKDAAAVTMHQVSLDELPVVLLLHLKCFQLDPTTPARPVKIVKPIDFPVELTIDTKIMSSKTKYQQKQRVYKLFAVVYHEGTEATKGHYVTDTSHPSGGWVRYDDSTVTQVTEQQVLKPKPPRMPYLVMYRRKDLNTGHRPGKAD